MGYEKKPARESELPPLPLKLLSWKPIRKGSLIGFASVRLGKSLEIDGIPVCATNGKAWASLPAAPMLDSNRTQKISDRGKPLYVPQLRWSDTASRDRFSAGVVALVEAEHPGATQPGSTP